MTQRQLHTAAQRVAEMERIFDILIAAKDTTAAQGAVFHALLRRLIHYYEGGQWRCDYELDERGLLPRELKRGVLSQDGIYNFLSDLRR